MVDSLRNFKLYPRILLSYSAALHIRKGRLRIASGDKSACRRNVRTVLCGPNVRMMPCTVHHEWWDTWRYCDAMRCVAVGSIDGSQHLLFDRVALSGLDVGCVVWPFWMTCVCLLRFMQCGRYSLRCTAMIGMEWTDVQYDGRWWRSRAVQNNV